jgi:peptidoglycan/LPS O-acetylase OafA/YrhL
VDALRALAALGVVVFHIAFNGGSLSLSVQSILSAGLRLGRLGVPLFLVLSGFCIHLSVARRIAGGEGVRSDWGRFWRRRFWRLYPPYVAAIVFSLAIYALAGAAAFPPRERIVSLPLDLLTHLLLIHNLFADYCLSLGNGPFWTLGLEEQLYALYALFLLLRRRCPIGRVVLFTLMVSLAWQCGWHVGLGIEERGGQATPGAVPLALGWWFRWPFGLWFAWALGALAAEAYVGSVRLPASLTRWRTALLLVLVGLATSRNALESLSARIAGLQLLLRILAGFSDLAFSGAAFVLVNRWVRQEAEGHFRRPVFRALGTLGVMSYSLYLIHMPLVVLLISWLPAGAGLDILLLRLVVIVPSCLGVAALFFFLVERHFLAGAPAGGSRAGVSKATIVAWISGLRWRSRGYRPKSAPPRTASVANPESRQQPSVDEWAVFSDAR